MYETIFPNILFLKTLVLTTIIVAVTDAVMFYVIWSGRRHITPLFVVGAIFITMNRWQLISGFIFIQTFSF